MAFDAHSNFGYSNVAAPAPGAAGTDLNVAPGQGALFPAAPFNCTVWPAGVLPLANNAEIVRVTAVVGDAFTIVRAQEGTSNINIQAGYQIANTASVKVFTDIESAPVISAGTQNQTGPFTFADGNGVTFGMDNGTITASVNPGGGGGVAISAGGNSQSTGTIVFANSNGITFGLDGAGNLTASHNGLTSQSNQAFSAQGGSSAFQTLIFANSNGLSFSNSNGSVVASYTVPNTAGLITAINLSAGTTSNNGTAFTFANGNGITFGMNGSVITASVGAGVAAGSISAGTQSMALGLASFADSNGITFGLSNSTLTASHNGLTSQSNQAASASNGSFAFQTLGFSNANGVTFGTSNGSIITASVNSGGAASEPILFSWETPPSPNGATALAGSHGVALIDPLNLPANISFTNIRQHGSFGCSLFSSNASSSVSIAVSRILGIYSRSVTDSAATNFSNSSVWASHLIATAFTSAIYSVSSVSQTYSFFWQTDSTGGLSSISGNTSGSTVGFSQFGFYQFINTPYAASLPKGDYIIMNYTLYTGTGGNSNSLVRVSAIANTIFASLSMAPAFGELTNNSVLPMMHNGVANLGASTSAPVATFVLSSFDRRINCNNFLFNA